MSANLYIQETFVNATEGHGIGESSVYETFTDHPGELYRAMQREYGRFISKIYIDKDGGPVAIGWVFQGRDKYEDTGKPYLREVWVTLHDAPDTVTREHHYHEIGSSL